ncbi:MAG TPA: efflux transporter outer membrane subunit [Steroidobacteraceae bacterium]|jgi:NodT family efflux transporter outer membrane factor (OMF) lipoprotein|nr:efflux transporter outer membrane subunit [Steroidobacteraceae bacterium]
MRHREWLPAPVTGNYLLAAAVAGLCGCTVGPDFHRPAPPATDHYLAGPPIQTVGAPAATQTLVAGQDIPVQWWNLFHSEPLDALVRLGLRDSPTIAAAAAALRSAQEGYVAQRGSLFPQVDGQFQTQREAAPGAAFGLPQVGTSTFTLFDAAVNVTYKFDLFGATRRQLEALAAQADYQRWQLEAARLTLAGNIVTTVITAAALNDEVAATDEMLTTERDQLAIIQRQHAVGAASQADVLTQQAQVSQLQATLPGLHKSVAQAGHRLAVLSGQTPDHASIGALSLSTLMLPAQLPVSVPAKLVRQRPDVLAAESQLHQASAQAGVATANLYPQLTLSGSIGSETTSITDLFGPGTAAWNIGGSLMQPLFHGGELRAKRRQAFDDLDQATAQYRGTVLSALQDVADTLRALQDDALTQQADAQAEAAARDSLEITRRQFQAGGTSYVNLLIAQRQYAQARLTRIQGEMARMTDSAALLQSLGGGWWNRDTQGSR